MITWGYSWAGAKILGPYGDVSAKIFLRFFLASMVVLEASALFYVSSSPTLARQYMLNGPEKISTTLTRLRPRR